MDAAAATPQDDPVREDVAGLAPGPPVLDDGYREEIRLSDGRRVRLRTVRPSDKRRLIEGLRRLSPASQLARFFATKATFTDEELRYLTELDGVNHFAIGAVELDARGEEGEGIGVARFVRDRDAPEVAEPAVAVIDAWQGRGIGRLLLERLVAAARERGIRYFRVQCLPGNVAVRSALEMACPRVPVREEGGTLVAEIPLPDVGAPPAAAHERGPLQDLLRAVARHVRGRGADEGESEAAH
jgi:GNAT superfamily N-acetyltransferase